MDIKPCVHIQQILPQMCNVVGCWVGLLVEQVDVLHLNPVSCTNVLIVGWPPLLLQKVDVWTNSSTLFRHVDTHHFFQHIDTRVLVSRAMPRLHL